MIEGQMNLFDFIKPEKINTKPRTEEITERELLKGSGFVEGKTRIYNFFQSEHTEKEEVAFLKKEYGVGGWSIPEGYADHDANGIDLKFDKEKVGNVTGLHIGWPMVAVRIKKLIAEGKYKPDELSPAEQWAEDTGFSDYWSHDIEFVNDKPVCKYSQHSCNRKELWKAAHTLDNIECPEVCCRKCEVKACGARCNGSEEPKDKVKCKKAAECEAYPDGCGGSIEDCKDGPYKWSKNNIEYKCITCAWNKSLDPITNKIGCIWSRYYPEEKKYQKDGCDRWRPEERQFKCCATCKYCNSFEYEGDDINNPIDEPNIYCTHKDGSKNRYCRWPEKVQKRFGVGLYHRQHEYDLCDNWELDTFSHKDCKKL